MAESPRPPIEGAPAAATASEVAPNASSPALVGAETLELVEERLAVSKRRRATGTVRVGTRTETVEATAEVELERYAVEVTRVPVGRAVDKAPTARAEGDTTIIPIVEERLVVVKQLFLVEELHVRHVLRRETVSEAVVLRKQRAVVECWDAEGRRVADGEPVQDPTADETRESS